MEADLLMNKKLYSVALLVVVSGMLVAGTFAWTNFSAQIINRFFGQGSGDTQNQRGPGGTLHNDFTEGEDYRDIYIENWGTEPMIVRIFLSEYMEIGPGAGDLAGNNEAVSLVEGALLSDQTTWTPFLGELETSNFRDYWRWTMGGQKYFFPAPEEYRGNNNDIEFVSTNSPPHLSPSDSENVQQTLRAEVITMDEWVSQGEPIGHYWVVDTDGFSYWAAPLLPEEATGLLLHKIEQIRAPAYNYFYALNVQGHMATIDNAPDNYERMLANASENASRLVNQLAEEIRLMDDEPAPTRSFTIEDYEGIVLPTLELIFEDDQNRFYLSSIRSSLIMLTFEDGLRVSLRQAIDDGLVTAADLIANGLELIVMPRLVATPVAGTPTPGTPTPNTPGQQTTATPTPWHGWLGPGWGTPLPATPTPSTPTPWPEGFTPTPRTITNTPTPWAGIPTETPWPEGFPTPITRTPTIHRTPTPWAGTPTETPLPEGVTPSPIVTNTPTYTPTPWPPAPTRPPYWWLTPTTAPWQWTSTPTRPNETPTPFAGTPTPTGFPDGFFHTPTWPAGFTPTLTPPSQTPTPWSPFATPTTAPLQWTPSPYSGSPSPTPWPEGGAMPSPTPPNLH